MHSLNGHAYISSFRPLRFFGFLPRTALKREDVRKNANDIFDFRPKCISSSSSIAIVSRIVAEENVWLPRAARSS